MDSLLSTFPKQGNKAIGYADDTIFIVIVDDPPNMASLMERALRRVCAWGNLSFNPDSLTGHFSDQAQWREFLPSFFFQKILQNRWKKPQNSIEQVFFFSILLQTMPPASVALRSQVFLTTLVETKHQVVHRYQSSHRRDKMVRLSKSIYQMNVARIVNSSQSFCSIAEVGAIFSLQSLKAMSKEKRCI